MRIGRWIMLGLAALLAILLIAVATIVLFVDPNRFKGEIERRFVAATGLTLHLTGDIEFDFLPWLALTTGESRLANPPGFESADIAKWNEGRVGVRFWPLLRGDLQIDRIRFVGLDVHLEKSAAGTANWSFGTDDAKSETPFDPASLPDIAGLELRDSSLRYVDVVAGTQVQISEWNLDLEPLRSGMPIDVDTSFVLQASPGLPQTNLDLETRVDLGPPLTLGDLNLEGQARGGPLGNDDVPLTLAAKRVSFDLDTTQFDVPDFTLRVGDLRANGKIAGALGESSVMNASVKANASSLRKTLATLGIALPATNDPEVFGRFELEASVTSMPSGLVAELRQLTLDDTHLTGRVTRASASDAAIEFVLDGDRMAIARYLEPKETSKDPFIFPGEMLRSLPVRGTLTLQEATFDDVTAKGVTLRVEHGVKAAESLR